MYKTQDIKFGYNIAPGGERYNTGLKWTDEQRKKIIEGHSGKNNALFGTHRSDETKAKISKALKGRVRSEEEMEHLSEAMQEFGKPVVCYETGQVFRSMAEAARWCGAKPPDLRNAVRHFPFYSVMGYHWFEESIDISGITIKPPRIWSSKSVMCVETKEKFDSMKEAADRYNTTVFFIRRACQQEGQVAAGYHWRFDNVQDTK